MLFRLLNRSMPRLELSMTSIKTRLEAYVPHNFDMETSTCSVVVLSSQCLHFLDLLSLKDVADLDYLIVYCEGYAARQLLNISN